MSVLLNQEIVMLDLEKKVIKEQELKKIPDESELNLERQRIENETMRARIQKLLEFERQESFLRYFLN